MTSAALYITGISNRVESVREKFAFSSIEGGAVVLRSQLDSSQDINSHLVWLWGILKHQRRFLKSLQSEGAHLSCLCKVPKGKVQILPNGAEMLHLLGVELVVEAK